MAEAGPSPWGAFVKLSQTVQCPTCGAAVGRRCRKPRGGDAPHPARLREVEKRPRSSKKKTQGPRRDRVLRVLRREEWTPLDEIAVQAGMARHNWRKVRTVLRVLEAEGLAESQG